MFVCSNRTKIEAKGNPTKGIPLGNFGDARATTQQYNQMSDYWNQSRKSITGSGLLTTYAHGYCHGYQKLENCNFHMDLWHL